jgi:hypothetical protein
MEPIEFKEQTKTLMGGSPDIAALPVWTDGMDCLSCWKPTFKERLSFLMFGRLWLWVRSGSTQPPVAIDIAMRLQSK